jgi:hypothetical protein
MSSVQSSRYLTSKSILGDAFPKSGAYPLKIEDKSTYYKNMFGEVGLL